MVEPEPEIWVLFPQAQFVGQARCINNTMIFSFLTDKIILEPEPKKLLRRLELEPEI